MDACLRCVDEVQRRVPTYVCVTNTHAHAFLAYNHLCFRLSGTKMFHHELRFCWAVRPTPPLPLPRSTGIESSSMVAADVIMPLRRRRSSLACHDERRRFSLFGWLWIRRCSRLVNGIHILDDVGYDFGPPAGLWRAVGGHSVSVPILVAHRVRWLCYPHWNGHARSTHNIHTHTQKHGLIHHIQCVNA